MFIASLSRLKPVFSSYRRPDAPASPKLRIAVDPGRREMDEGFGPDP
jgi:hypothetical protein